MRRLLAVVVVLALLGGGGWWAYRHFGRRQVKAVVKVPTAAVEQGHLTVALPVNGVLGSAEETQVRTEIVGKILQICQNSSTLKKGDLVVAVDPKERIDERDKLQKSLTDAKEAARKAEADAQVRLDQASSGVTKAEEALALAKTKAEAEAAKAAATTSFAKGELDRAERELHRDRRLAELRYIADTTLRATERAYRQKQFDYEKQQRAEADSKAQGTEDITAAEKALEIAKEEQKSAQTETRLAGQDAARKVADIERQLREVEAQIAKCKVMAPVGGLAVLGVNYTSWPQRSPWRVGDEINPGNVVVQIYNVDLMQVRCQIGEMDIGRLKTGQRAYVLSPTQPAKRYPGEVTAVEELGHDADVWSGGTPGKKTFGAIVSIDEPDPKHLRPGMTVDLEIVLEEPKNVLTAPIGAVFAEGRRRLVYRAVGSRFEAVPVTLGVRSDLQVEVRGKLAAGDRVALVRPPASRLATARGGKP